MAKFAYRVTGPKGILGGFRDMDDAVMFAQAKSLQVNAYVCVWRSERGKADVAAEILAGFLGGDRIK